MIDWWEKNGPPVYIAVAAYMGLIETDDKADKPKAANDEKKGDLNELFQALSGSGGVING